MACSDIAPAFHVNYLRRLPSTALCVLSDWEAMEISDSDSDTVANHEDPNAVMETSLGSSDNFGAIYRLPGDILFYIFYMGTHLDEYGGNFPVVVSHVCRFWRLTALRSPLLWTNIRISSTSINSLIRYDGPVAPRASTFIARSAQCSLDVKLDLTKRRPAGDIPEDTLFMYFQLLCTTAVDLLVIAHDRIKSLEIATDFREVSFWISCKVVPLGMPRLESWKIHRGDSARTVNSPWSGSYYRGPPEFDASGDRGGSFERPTDTIGDRLPRLKNLQMSQTVANWSTWFIGGLRTLTINHLAVGNRPSISTLRDILASSYSLESLELHGSLPVHPLDCLVPITLPKLRHLRFGYWAQEEALVLLPHLDLPALKSLALCDIAGSIHEHHRRMIGRGGQATDIPIDLTFRGIPINQDLDSTYLLQALCSSRAALLGQLESLELTRVQSLSIPVNLSEDWLHNVFPRHQVCLARFLLSMQSLRTLTLDGPDVGFLHCFNHPFQLRVGHPDSPGGVQRHVIHLGARLSTLRIFDIEYDDLLDFFFNRAELARDPSARNGLPIFDTLEFALDKLELEQFKSECPSSNGAVDIFSFSRNTICRVYEDRSYPKIPFV
ncbi:hypothetical protein J3A83DRAFT_4373475 [Scleroderma citrinum]